MIRFYFNTVFLFFVLFGLSFSQAQTNKKNKLSQEAKAARDFAFENISLSVTKAGFLEHFPDATKDNNLSDDSIDLICYMTTQTEYASGFAGIFLGEEMSEMRIVYTFELVDKMGGLDVLLGRTKKKFGSAAPDDVEYKEDPFYMKIVWRFPEVNRHIQWNIENKYARLEITNTEVYQRMIEKRKQKAKTGFDDN